MCPTYLSHSLHISLYISYMSYYNLSLSLTLYLFHSLYRYLSHSLHSFLYISYVFHSLYISFTYSIGVFHSLSISFTHSLSRSLSLHLSLSPMYFYNLTLSIHLYFFTSSSMLSVRLPVQVLCLPIFLVLLLFTFSVQTCSFPSSFDLEYCSQGSSSLLDRVVSHWGSSS